MHEQDKAICEALGDRARGWRRRAATSGSATTALGAGARDARAAQGDGRGAGGPRGVARACGNLGLCYESTGD